MNINTTGIELIKRFEGCLLTAYPDPGTGGEPLTIGFGHTSAAGAPRVTKGMRISRDEAGKILRDDLQTFSAGVRKLIKREMNDNQFSAIVSFAYNVGLGALKKSSVLRAINSGDFKSVARRLAMYRKANGKVLSGLVKRRAAEGTLFNTPNMVLGLAATNVAGFQPSEHEIEEMRAFKGQIEVDKGKPMSKSTTIWSGLGVGAAAMYEWGKDILYQVQEVGGLLNMDSDLMIKIGLGIIIVGGIAWIIRERYKKSQELGV